MSWQIGIAAGAGLVETGRYLSKIPDGRAQTAGRFAVAAGLFFGATSEASDGVQDRGYDVTGAMLGTAFAAASGIFPIGEGVLAAAALVGAQLLSA